MVYYAEIEAYTEILIAYAWLALIDALIRPRQESNYIRSKEDNENTLEKVVKYINSNYISILLIIIISPIFLVFNKKFINIEYVLILVILNLILINLTYIYNIVGEHHNASKVQLLWNLSSFLIIIIFYQLNVHISLFSVTVIRFLSIIISIAYAHKWFFIFMKSIIKGSPFIKINQLIQNFSKEIYFVNVLSTLLYSSPLLIINFMIGREFVASIGLAKQISDVVYRLIPSAISSYILDSYSKLSLSEKNISKNNVNFLIAFIAGLVIAIILSLSMPIIYLFLNKSFESNIINVAIIIIISFLSVSCNFYSLYFVAKCNEKNVIRYYVNYFSILFLILIIIYMANLVNITPIIILILNIFLYLIIILKVKNNG